MATYVNPLAHAGISARERVDEGVDFAVTGGYLVAIGDYRVTYASNQASGWPGGQVQYVLTEPGPLEGAIIYYAEGVTMWKSPGDTGRWGDGICALIPYWHSGIEIGFGSNNPPDTWARDNGGGYDGSNSTNSGVAFNNLLRALGAPYGYIEGSPSGGAPPWNLSGGSYSVGQGGGVPAPPIDTETIVAGLDPSKEVRDISDQWAIHGSRTWNHALDIAERFRTTSYVTDTGPR